MDFNIYRNDLVTRFPQYVISDQVVGSGFTAEATITSTSITSVTDNGGIAVFNHAGTSPPVDSLVTITGFITNTTYNGSFRITLSTATTFETGVAFGTNETGDYTAQVVISGYASFQLEAYRDLRNKLLEGEDPLPQATTTQKDSYTDVETNFHLVDSDLNQIQYFDSVNWVGPPGSGGASVSGSWKFDNSTTESNPGSGNFRTNNATIGSVTKLFISHESESGSDVTNIINLLSSGDVLYLQNAEDSTEFLTFNITINVDNGSWSSITGTVSNSNSNFTNGKEFGIVFLFGGAGPSANGLPLNFASFNGSGGLSYISSTTVQVTAGSWRDSANSFDLILGSNTNVVITTTGAGGLQTGSSESSNTWYGVYAIGDTSGSNVTTTLLIPEGVAFNESGYDVIRNVGWVKNNAGADFFRFNTEGKGSSQIYLFDIDAQSEILTAGSATTFTDIDCSAFIPPTSILGFFQVGVVASAAFAGITIRPNGAGGTYAAFVTRPGIATTITNRSFAAMITDEDRIIEYEMINAGDDGYLSIQGFKVDI